MKKYFLVFLCFIGSLILVSNEDNGELAEKYEENILVFNEYGIVKQKQPDTSDINVEMLFVISGYSLLFTILSFKDLKKISM